MVKILYYSVIILYYLNVRRSPKSYFGDFKKNISDEIAKSFRKSANNNRKNVNLDVYFSAVAIQIVIFFLNRVCLYLKKTLIYSETVLSDKTTSL